MSKSPWRIAANLYMRFRKVEMQERKRETKEGEKEREWERKVVIVVEAIKGGKKLIITKWLKDV